MSDSILGKTATGPRPNPSLIEVWTLDRTVAVAYTTEELQAVCPVTHQPDIYSATIAYTGERTVESKALKHYLWSFRDRPISAEWLAIQIASDLTDVLGLPVSVKVAQQVRGGLCLTATATGELP